MGKIKKKILQYVITIAVCSLITFIVLALRGIFNSPEPKQVAHYLTDAFFAVGIITTMVGLLIFVSNGGVFDMLVYGVYRFITILFKKDHRNVKYNTFYDYRVAKAERPKASFLFLIIVGLIFVGISMIFLVQWYQFE